MTTGNRELRKHDHYDFSPGKIVCFELYTQPQLVWDGVSEPMSEEDFFKHSRARPRRLEYFAIYATNAEFSSAVRIHPSDLSDPQQPPRPAEHQAVIYTGAHTSTVKGNGKSPANPPIQVRAYAQQALPKDSRLDYSDLYLVEHTYKVAFVGEITEDSWPVFAETYWKVQKSIGYDRELPTLEATRPPAVRSMEERLDEGGVAQAAKPATPNMTIDSAELRVHGRGDFVPGRIVKFLYSGPEYGSEREESLDSDDESTESEEYQDPNPFDEHDHEPPQTMEYFIIFRTYSTSTVALRIHIYDPDNPQERKRLPEHQAILYTDSRAPRVRPNQKPPGNQAIRVKMYPGQTLPAGSRLLYSDLSYVDQDSEVAFVGEITDDSWPIFANTYLDVQKMRGWEVRLPTREHPDDKPLRVHASGEFSPGKIVKFDHFVDLPKLSRNWTRGKRPITLQEFAEADLGQSKKMYYFAIVRTWDDCSLAVRIHSYDSQDPEEMKRLADNQAIISTESHICPIKAADKHPGNTAIRVNSYGDERLPAGSRLDYSDTFYVEHGYELAFVGEITSVCWPDFAATYRKVQNNIGNDVELPTLDAAAPSPARSCDEPNEEASATQANASTEQHTASEADRGFASEAPVYPLRRVPLGESKTESIQQGTFGQPYNGYPIDCGCRETEMGLSSRGLHQPQVVIAFDGDAEKPEIKEARQWMNRVTNLRRQILKQAIDPNQSVESLCDPCDGKAAASAASRVKVAILDTAIDFNDEAFCDHRDRLKEYKDFRQDGQVSPVSSDHGTHVTSLLFRMAPEADVYVGQVLDSFPSLVLAIRHAVNHWKVDLISISLGGSLDPDESIRNALQWAAFKRVHVFAALHNACQTPLDKMPSYPARDHRVYPVFATYANGKPGSTAAEPAHSRPPAYATMGEDIPVEWIRGWDPRYISIKGSSFATPVLVGIVASMLFFTRLIHIGEQYEDAREKVSSREVMDEMLARLSTVEAADFRTARGGTVNAKYRYVQPEAFWKTENLVQAMRQMVEAIRVSTESQMGSVSAQPSPQAIAVERSMGVNGTIKPVGGATTWAKGQPAVPGSPLWRAKVRAAVEKKGSKQRAGTSKAATGSSTAASGQLQQQALKQMLPTGKKAASSGGKPQAPEPVQIKAGTGYS